MGSARIEFELQSYMMNNVTIPSSDLTGNLPVQSMYVMPSFESMVVQSFGSYFNIYTVIPPTLGGFRGELSFPRDQQVEQRPEP